MDLTSADREFRGPRTLSRDSSTPPGLVRPVEEHFRSADSAPGGFAVTRSHVVTPLLLASFAIASWLIALTHSSLVVEYVGLLTAAVDHGVPQPSTPVSLSFRPYILAFILLLGVFSAGSLTSRVRYALVVGAGYAGITFTLDVFMLYLYPVLAAHPLSQVGGIVAGLVGLVLPVVGIFTLYRLPSGIQVSRRLKSPRRVGIRLGFTVVVAAIFVLMWLQYVAEFIARLNIPLLGSLSSFLVLFLLLATALLYLAGARALPDRLPKHFRPSIGFLIPAYNEAHEIARCIRSIDAAAAEYEGVTRLYIVDNASEDETADVARDALRQCHHIEGSVDNCERKGKGYALNCALLNSSEEVVIRVDADTLVSSDFLRRLIPHFADPTVAGVSGLALPRRPRTWLGNIRLMELYYSVAFMRLAQTTLDSVMVMPGVMAAYRRRVVVGLGGFGVGFNAEDADITVRIGRLGFTVVTDPRVHVRTEVPSSLPHLTEQRRRWARGLFHMAGRNLSMIRMRQGVRGLWLLPWTLLNSSKRFMMIPILLAALMTELITPEIFALKEVSMIAGFVVGLQLLIIAILLVVNGHARATVHVPSYLLFRIYRAYVSLDSLLTMRLK